LEEKNRDGHAQNADYEGQAGRSEADRPSEFMRMGEEGWRHLQLLPDMLHRVRRIISAIAMLDAARCLSIHLISAGWVQQMRTLWKS
jgi:hypothetical protein